MCRTKCADEWCDELLDSLLHRGFHATIGRKDSGAVLIRLMQWKQFTCDILV